MVHPVNTGCQGKYKKSSITSKTKIWFGRYEGWPLRSIPPDYILFLYFNIQELDPALKRWIAARKQYFFTQLFLGR